MESATVPAEHVIEPTKTIPKATVLGTLVTAVIYVLGTIAVMGVLPRAALTESGAPFADAAQAMWGNWAYYAVALGAMISCAGALNGWTLLQGQIPMAAAQDDLFPKEFGHLSRRGVPVFSVVVSSILITILLALNYSGSKSLVEIFNFIILLATMTTLIPYVFCSIAEFIIFIQDPAHHGGQRRFKSSGVVAAIAFIYSVWAIYGSGAETVLYGFILLLFGIPVYVWLIKERQAKLDRQYASGNDIGSSHESPSSL